MKLPRLALITLILMGASAFSLTNPVPLLNQPLNPSSSAPGANAFTLTVTGTGFVSGATVLWNGSPRQTTFVSGSRLTAKIAAADVATRGTAAVSVANPAPNGAVSNVAYFPVTAAGPVGFMRGEDLGTGVAATFSVAADFNHDGRPDLALVSLSTASVAVLLSNGDGTFQAASVYPVGASPEQLVAADFNGDGNLDLATTSVTIPNTFLNIFLGNADGTFQPVRTSAGVDAFGLLAADFNGDGNVDLISITTGSLYMQLGNGDGTFGSARFIGITSFPETGAAGDFNGDGILDFVVANNGTFNVTIFLGNGDGTFVQGGSFAASIGVASVIALDFNNDGKLDIAATGPYPVFGDVFDILSGNGDGTFQPVVQFGSGNGAETILAGEFNGDNHIDLVTANFDNKTVTVLSPDGGGRFPRTDFWAGLRPGPLSGGGIVTADFNGDGRLDLVAADGRSGLVNIMLQSEIAISNTRLRFRTAGQTLPVTVTNIGTRSVKLSGITITGTGSGEFSQSNNCGGTLSPNANCVVQVTFLGGGDARPWLNIFDDARSSPQTAGIRILP